MAYTPVPVVATGDLWSAADHNTYIRDNFAAGVPDIFTAKGDLCVASGPNAATVLPIGTDYQRLQCRAASTKGLEWVSQPPSVMAYRAALQTIANNTPTDITFTSEIFDTPAGWITPPSTTCTVPASCNGLCHITCLGYWSGHATPNKLRQVGVVIGSIGTLYASTTQDADTQAIWVNFSFEVLLGVGDTVKMRVVQISGGNLDFNEARMTIARII